MPSGLGVVLIPRANIKHFGAMCAEVGAMVMNSKLGKLNPAKGIGKADELFRKLNGTSNGLWIGKDSRMCGKWVLPDPTAVFISSDSRRSIPSVLGLTLEPRKSYMFLTNRRYTCVYRSILPGTSVATESKSPSPTPSPLPTNDGALCFPATATVQLESGRTVSMHQLTVGDRVHVGNGIFSPVFIFTHAAHKVSYNFVSLDTASGLALSLTPGHYLYVNGVLSAARIVLPGDSLRAADGSADVVIRVRRTRKTGLYNPQTLHGDIAVDGVVASTFTTTVDPSCAQGMLAPLRAVYSALGIALRGLLDNGADSVARFLPKGVSVH